MRWVPITVLVALLGVLAYLGFRPRDHAILGRSIQKAAPTVEKQPLRVTTRTFNPADPPADMPPLTYGENAECDTNFASKATVRGQTRWTDATHAVVTVTGVDVNLQLDVVIWLPDEVTQHVAEHEDGHRQISEYFYKTADHLAAQIAAEHIGQEIVVSGTDLRAEADQALQQIGADITDEYGKQLNYEAAQLRFDAITDHSRNNVSAADGVAQALADVPSESTDSTGSTGAVADPGN